MTKNLSVWEQTLKTAHGKFHSINKAKATSELGFALQIFQGNDYLQKCDPTSILNAVVNVARTSITLNPVMKLAYLIPRDNKCVLEFSYMGLVAMLRDNGCIKSISAHIVYENEEFDYQIAENKIIHKPNYAKTEAEHNSREMIGCYSRATLPNNEIVYEFMPMWEIDKIRKFSKNSSSKYSAWNTWRDEMIKKSVIKRHFKMLISGNPTEALSTALKVEFENNALLGLQKENQSVLNGFSEVSEVSEQIPSLFADDLTDELVEVEITNPLGLTDEEVEAELNKTAEIMKDSQSKEISSQNNGQMTIE